MSSLWSHPPCPSSQIPHPVSYLRTGQTTLMHSLAPGRESAPAASLRKASAVIGRRRPRDLSVSQHSCAKPSWPLSGVRLPEVARNAGGGLLWCEDALGSGWFIPLTKSISAASPLSERRRWDQGGGTKSPTCWSKPSGNDSKWPWYPDQLT